MDVSVMYSTLDEEREIVFFFLDFQEIMEFLEICRTPTINA